MSQPGPRQIDDGLWYFVVTTSTTQKTGYAWSRTPSGLSLETFASPDAGALPFTANTTLERMTSPTISSRAAFLAFVCEEYSGAPLYVWDAETAWSTSTHTCSA